MKRYRISHTTTYAYEPAVRLSHALLHLSPAQFPTQQINSATLHIEPAPDTRLDSIDSFANPVTWASIERHHERSTFRSTLDIMVGLPQPPIDEFAADARHLGQVRLESLGSSRLDVRWCRLGSAFAPTSVHDEEVSSLFADERRPLIDIVYEILSWFARSFRFDPMATDVSTPVAEVLQNRAGVCQDFAHVAVSLLRSQGLSARYVSGYLRTLSSDVNGVPLVGADASHAWVSVWNGVEWLDFDPTNNMMVGEHHIRLAVGRDYADIAPVRGVTIGPPHRQELSISVDTIEIA